jgi:hypothetical protein
MQYTPIAALHPVAPMSTPPDEAEEEIEVGQASRRGRRPRQDELPSFGSLLSLARASAAEVTKTAAVPPLHIEEPNEATGTLWAWAKQEHALHELTNFHQEALEDLYRAMVPHFDRHRRRGPVPLITGVDTLIVILAFYKTGCTIKQLARVLGRKPSTLLDSISRTRPVLLATLQGMIFFF